jgi:5-methylcytosine-specific restriction endonuclease McrA
MSPVPKRAPIAKTARFETQRRAPEYSDPEIDRLYDTAQWRSRTRLHVLARDPLCRLAILCEGRAPSTNVDHIIQAELFIAKNGGDLTFFFDETNLRGGCQACHSRKTALEQRGLWKERMG